MSKVYPATSLTGGVSGALDAIDGTDLTDKDVAMVTVQGDNFYPYSQTIATTTVTNGRIVYLNERESKSKKISCN